MEVIIKCDETLRKYLKLEQSLWLAQELGKLHLTSRLKKCQNMKMNRKFR